MKRGPNEIGGSRAAKKRAKKKKQQQQQQKLQKKKQIEKDVEHSEEVSDAQDNHTIQTKNKTKKTLLQLPMDDDDDGSGDGKVANGDCGILDVGRKDKTKTKKSKTTKTACATSVEHHSNDNDEEQYEDDDQELEEEEEQMVEQFLSKLTPAQILFPETQIQQEGDDNASDGNEPKANDDEQPDPSVLVQHISTEKRARILFNAILAPSGIQAEQFYQTYWEKEPLLISLNKNMADDAAADDADEQGTDCHVVDNENKVMDPTVKQQYQQRLDGFLSKKDIENLISNYPMQYGKDLNVTRYCDAGDGSGAKRRITLDLLPNTEEGKDAEYIVAESKDVWSNFSDGCTIRLLCPHKHNDRVHSLLSTLEHEFGCMVGANAYLTPGGSAHQGFAPHYDDIEALILQLEGYKHWRVYPPMNKGETLPRESSRDYTEEEMEGIKPVIDVELGPGDVLYMPRGWVHQANTCHGGHSSLHLTVSAMQHWAWADFLELIMPEALEAATSSETSTSLREGLPRNFLNYMGAMHDQNDEEDMPEGLKQIASQKSEGTNDTNKNGTGSTERETTLTKSQQRIKKMQLAFKAEAKKRIMRVCKEALSMVTAGCDQIGKRFLSDRLPPAFSRQEVSLTSENRTENGGKIWPNTMVRLARPGIARLVLEDGKAVLYHSVDNSRVFHGNPLSPLEFEIDDAPALEMLLTTTEPRWICVKDLIHGDIEDKMDIAQSLYDEGILAIHQEESPDRSVQVG